MVKDIQVLIVGAGVAGLCCASHLQKRGVDFQILEAADAVGGRIRTDRLDGFLLDRGFQVLLTAYPEAQSGLNYSRLSLSSFYPGALIRARGRFQRLADPFRRPADAVATLLSQAGTLADKLRVARLYWRVNKGSIEDIFNRPETSTIKALRDEGFSDSIIEQFFRPFLGGIFLERGLQTSSRMFEFIFRMFSSGETALPAAGMGAIPEQVASALPADSIRLRASVASVENGVVTLVSGERLTADVIVIATERDTAARLLGENSSARYHGVSCLYFAAEKSPVNEPVLVLNGESSGPINNMCVPSVVSPSYAPAGGALISVSVLEDAAPSDNQRLVMLVREQLRDWFGPVVDEWEHLKSYKIARALPDQKSLPTSGDQSPFRRVRSCTYLCGDYFDTASINGAMRSGRLTAAAIIADHTHRQAYAEVT